LSRLRDILRPLLLLIAAVGIPAVAPGAANVGRIVAPTAEAPRTVEPGEAFNAVIRLNLPLTPPPGVQQAKAWEGWSVGLARRVDVALGGASPLIGFPARLVRIRPAADDRYRVAAETPPWLPPGRYDLAITGPGFDGIAGESIVVPASRSGAAGDAGLEQRLLAGQEVELLNRGAAPVAGVLEVAIPQAGGGLRAALVDEDSGEAASLPLLAALWTEGRSDGGADRARLLRFAVVVPGAKGTTPGRSLVRLEDARPASCNASIRLVDEDTPSDPMAWRELEYVGGEPVTVIWDFGDGQRGAGRRVRHRWLLSTEARVVATGFDRHGSPCTAALEVSGVISGRRSCGCSTVGTLRGPGLLWEFFLSATLFGE
jgi:hypothetical protein